MLLAALAPPGEYCTVHIHISAPADNGAYTVELRVGLRGFPPAQVQFDRNKLLKLNNNPQEYGLALGKMLFGPKALGPAYAETLAFTKGRGMGRRIRLECDPPELSEIRWERLYHPLEGDWLPLGSTAACPFSRLVRPQSWDWEGFKPLTERPLRVLAVIASPADLTGYELDSILPAERLALHRVLDGLSDVSVTYLESGTADRPTLQALRGRLTRGYHIVHFLCHGAATPAGTVLYLEGDDGQVEPVEASRLIEAVKLCGTPPALVFLAACETAVRASHDAFVPLGPALVGPGGVAAVVAMTEQVGIETARLFTEQFYARLFSHGVVDLAVNEARALVQDDNWDWSAPVLFSRLDDNQLLDFPQGDHRSVIEKRKDFEPETILVPAGPFLMGSDDPTVPAAERPQHTVELPAYRIGKRPVTVAEYAAFVQETRAVEWANSNSARDAGWFNLEPPAMKLDDPVTGVSWLDAMAYCRWLSAQTGRRYTLPSEAEWEKAAFPSPIATGEGLGVGAWLGVVQQWTRSLWGTQPDEPRHSYQEQPGGGPAIEDPAKLPAQARLVHRGGSFKSQPADLRPTARGNAVPDSRIAWRGFRVVMVIE